MLPDDEENKNRIQKVIDDDTKSIEKHKSDIEEIEKEHGKLPKVTSVDVLQEMIRISKLKDQLRMVNTQK